MKNNRLQFLLKLLVDNEINKQQLEELDELLSEANNEEAIDTQFKDTWDNVAVPTGLNSEVYQQIIAHPRFSSPNDTTKSISAKQNRLRPWYYYAAAILLTCCGIGLCIYQLKFDNGSTENVSANYDAKKSVTTSGNQTHVTLKLSNGKELVLDEANFGKIVTEDQVSIIKNKDGQLVYDLSKVVDNGELAYNTIRTPVGSNYQVVLSDGTKVWLNAKSSLKFPAVFKGAQRQVELSGEAYFEVAHNKKQPFVLSAKQMTVRVLGTHFNVSAYDDDETVTTSLLEGAVKASYQTSTLLLNPGQQAVLKNNLGKMSQSSFEADEVMDWRNGYFIFRNEPIDEIMKKISRWYHIDVSYEGQSTKEAFGGKYVKSSSLAELLSSLELTGTVKFKIEGRRVTVMQ